jgi:hypothetical protein
MQDPAVKRVLIQSPVFKVTLFFLFNTSVCILSTDKLLQVLAKKGPIALILYVLQYYSVSREE